MASMSMAEARENFADVMNNAFYRHERTVINRRGKDLGAIVPLEDLKMIEAWEDHMDALDAEAAMREIETDGAISLAEFKKELGLQ